MHFYPTVLRDSPEINANLKKNNIVGMERNISQVRHVLEKTRKVCKIWLQIISNSFTESFPASSGITCSFVQPSTWQDPQRLVHRYPYLLHPQRRFENSLLQLQPMEFKKVSGAAFLSMVFAKSIFQDLNHPHFSASRFNLLSRSDIWWYTPKLWYRKDEVVGGSLSGFTKHLALFTFCSSSLFLRSDIVSPSFDL